MWDIGPNFHLFPSFTDVLEDQVLGQVEKIDLIYGDGVSEAQAKAALDGADDSYWYRPVEERDALNG